MIKKADENKRLGDEKKEVYLNVIPLTHARMKAVRTKNTPPEMQVRRILHSLGYRFRLHKKDIPGTPDIVLPRHKKIIFVHGCFWHGHLHCRRARLPQNNRDVWRKKIKSNSQRDKNNIKLLQKLGWSVLVIWECELRNVEYAMYLLYDFLSDRCRT